LARAIALAAGALLIAVSFVAAFSVADSRQGLVAEVVTLISGLAGTGLLLYGLVPKRRSTQPPPPKPAHQASPPRPRTANDLLLGSAGLLLAAVLVAGLTISGGWLWALLGGLLLLPMAIGCTYMVAAFLRAPDRDWRIDLRRLTGHRPSD